MDEYALLFSPSLHPYFILYFSVSLTVALTLILAVSEGSQSRDVGGVKKVAGTGEDAEGKMRRGWGKWDGGVTDE